MKMEVVNFFKLISNNSSESNNVKKVTGKLKITV